MQQHSSIAVVFSVLANFPITYHGGLPQFFSVLYILRSVSFISQVLLIDETQKLSPKTRSRYMGYSDQRYEKGVYLASVYWRHHHHKN